MNSRIRHYIDLIAVLTHKEMKVRYKSTFFGYLWSIAHPLAFAFVFFMAFKVVMRIQMEGYAVFLIAGLFPWQWLSNSVTASPMVFLLNASLIKKVSLPRNILPLATVLQDMIHFLLAIPVIVLFLFIYHKSPVVSWLYGIPAWPKIDYEIDKTPDQPHEAGMLRLDCSKARSKLQWASVWDGKAAVEKMAQWYRAFYESNEVQSMENLHRYIADAQRKHIAWAEE